MPIPEQRSNWLLAAVLFAVTLTYANHFGNGFHFDDGHAITANPAVRSLANVPRFFTDTTTSSVLPANQTYRPIVSTSLAIDYALGHGYSNVWFQASTFLVFLAQLVAMYALFSTTIAANGATARLAPVALVATAWYGLHPAIAETVNYIVQRADVYSTFGVVLALLIYARYPNSRRFGWYLLPALFAMFSKAPAVVFPLLLFAYIALFETADDRGRFGIAALRSSPALGLGVASLLLQHAMTPPTFRPSTLSAAAYLVTQPYVLLRYALSFFAPLHLSVDSDLSPIAPGSLAAVSGDLFLAALVAAAVVASRRAFSRPAAFGLFWFVIADVPTAVFPLSEVENDHRMFFPFVGMTLAVTWTLAAFVSRAVTRRTATLRKRAIAIATVAGLIAYATGTIARNAVWHTDESLWYDAARKSPKNGRALMNYGLSEMQLGKYVDAQIYFDRAEALTPNYSTLEINEGVLADAMGRSADAEKRFRRAIDLAPSDDQPRYFYANWLRSKGRLAESIAQASAATKLTSPALDSRTVLLHDLSDAGRHDEAHALALETLRLVPGDAAARAFLVRAKPADASYWLGLSLQQYGAKQYDRSIASARRALADDASLAEAYNNIGAAENAQHRYEEAIVAERRALALEPTLQIARNNLTWSLEHRPRTSR